MSDKETLTVEKDVAEEARDLGIDVNRVAEEAIAKAAKLERNRRWVEENREALDQYAQRIEEEGLALEKYRLF